MGMIYYGSSTPLSTPGSMPGSGGGLYRACAQARADLGRGGPPPNGPRGRESARGRWGARPGGTRTVLPARVQRVELLLATTEDAAAPSSSGGSA